LRLIGRDGDRTMLFDFTLHVEMKGLQRIDAYVAGWNIGRNSIAA